MISFFLTLLYITVLFTIGFLASKYFFNKKFNIYEKIGSALGLGLIINFINMLFFSLLKINLNTYTLLFASLAWFIFFKIKIKFNFKDNFKTFLNNIRKIDLMSIILLLLIASVLFGIFYKTVILGFCAWDEFSFWGKATKMIFNTQNIFIQKYVTPESSANPLFWPASAGSIAIFTGEFVENHVKLLTPFILTSLCFYIYGYLERLNLLLKEKLLIILFFISSSQIFLLYSSTLYADTPYIYFYTLGALILFRVFLDKFDRSYLAASLPFFAALTIVKLGGSILALTTIAAFYLTHLKDVFKKKNFLFCFAYPIFLIANQILWILISRMAGETKSTFANVPFQNINEFFTSIGEMIYRVIERLNNKYGFSYFWYIAFGTYFSGIIFFRKKIYMASLITILLYSLYIFTAYFILFTRKEMIVAASFERYILPMMPIVIITFGHFYVEIRKIITSKISKGRLSSYDIIR